MSTETVDLNDEFEDLTGLISPAGFPIDLALVDNVLELPTISLLIAIGSDDERIANYMNDPRNQSARRVLEAFRGWVRDQTAESSRDLWSEYLGKSRDELVDAVWSQYDSRGVVEFDARDLIGDNLIGTAIFFRFLAEAGVITDADEGRFVSLWNWALVMDLMSVDSEEDETAVPTEEKSEW
jgi:hypothetical protein